MSEKVENLKAELYKLQEEEEKLSEDYNKSSIEIFDKMLNVSVKIARLHIDEIGKDVKD